MGTDELVEHWTLLPRETELITNKTGAARLGFAVLLKFFQLEAYFPQHASAVPTVAVEFIAKQVKVAPEQFEQYQHLFLILRRSLLGLNKEAVGIHVLLTRSLFDGGILRRMLRRVSPSKAISATLQF